MTQTSKKSPVSSQPTKSKGLPPLAIAAIGCVGILILISIVLGIAGKALFSQLGQKFIGNTIKQNIEKQTGISVETGKNGELVSLKNEKEGTAVNIGDTKIPADFPKDFPLYSGAKPTGNIVDEQKGEGKGFWLMMESTDDASKIMAFYDSELKGKGWTVDEKMSSGNGASYQVWKGTLEGTVVVNGEEKKGATTILIALSPKAKTSESGE